MTFKRGDIVRLWRDVLEAENAIDSDEMRDYFMSRRYVVLSAVDTGCKFRFGDAEARRPPTFELWPFGNNVWTAPYVVRIDHMIATGDVAEEVT